MTQAIDDSGEMVRTLAHLRSDEARQHLERANTRLLLACAVQLSGDRGMLEKYVHRLGPPEASSSMPFEIRTSAPHAQAQEDPTVRNEILDELLAAAESREPSVDELLGDPELFHRLTTMVSGMDVPRAHVEMNLEQAGFVAESRTVLSDEEVPPGFTVGIIGAGMAGIDAAVKASLRGINYEIFESAGDVGGLWHSQRYPGVAVDTPSIYYSLSWQPSAEWSRDYPTGSEYLRYLRQIVDAHDIRRRVRFNTEVVRMRWIEADRQWELTLRSRLDDSTVKRRVDVVVSCAGNFNRPNYPPVAGREDFAGESVHTVRWQPIDLTDKRVAVVGTGASSVQVVAAIADEVKHLTVFQRQAPWMAPPSSSEGVVSAHEQWLLRHVPFYLQWSRLTTFAQIGVTQNMLSTVDPEWIAEHPDSINEFNNVQREICLRYIEGCFGNSDMAARVTPGYVYGGKRRVRDPGRFTEGEGYFHALSRDNVDLETSGIDRVVPTGIATKDGQLVELDVIVWATGFTIDILELIEVVGRDHVRLSDFWEPDGARTGIGGTVPGFPNLFVHDGPNTAVARGGAGHNYIVETFNHYIFEAIALMLRRGATSIELSEDAFKQYNDRIDSEMSGLVWSYATDANTYYRNDKGRTFFPNPFETSDLWGMSREPVVDDFVFTDDVDGEEPTSEAAHLE